MCIRDSQEAFRRVRASVARAFALQMRRVARGDVNGDAGVNITVAAFDQINKPASGSGDADASVAFHPGWRWAAGATLAATDERHLGRHDGNELDVGRQRQ